MANNITTIACNNILSIKRQDMRDRRSGWKKEMQSPCPPVDPAIHGGSSDSPPREDTNTERRLNHALATDNRTMRRVAQATLEQVKPTPHQNVRADGEIQRMCQSIGKASRDRMALIKILATQENPNGF
jgi:hypothetical protein